MLLWSRPRRRFGDFAAAGKVTRRPQAAKLPCAINMWKANRLRQFPQWNGLKTQLVQAAAALSPGYGQAQVLIGLGGDAPAPWGAGEEA